MSTIAALPQAVALRPGSITGMARMSEHINRPRKPTTVSVPSGLWTKVEPVLQRRGVDDAELLRQVLTAYVIGDFDPAAVSLPEEYKPRRGRPTRDRTRVDDDKKVHGNRVQDEFVSSRPTLRLSEVEQWALNQRALQAGENGETVWNRSAVVARGAYLMLTQKNTFGQKAMPGADLESPVKTVGVPIAEELWTRASAKFAERHDVPEKMLRRTLFAYILDEFDPASVVLPEKYGPGAPTTYVQTGITVMEKWALDRKALVAARTGAANWPPAAIIAAGLQTYVTTRKGARLPF
jgi:hypothetical protein